MMSCNVISCYVAAKKLLVFTIPSLRHSRFSSFGDLFRDSVKRGLVAIKVSGCCGSHDLFEAPPTRHSTLECTTSKLHSMLCRGRN